MNIGEVSKRAGLPVKTVRYYEEIRLVTADRQANGYRDYSQAHLHQLSFLKRAREFGFSLDDCRTLLDLYANPQRASADVKALAKRHLSKLSEKAAELQTLSDTLSRLVEQCAGNAEPDCPIIEDLAEPAVKQERTKSRKAHSSRQDEGGLVR